MKKITKKAYTKPKVEKIKIDRNISMVMMSPPGDPPVIPGGSLLK